MKGDDPFKKEFYILHFTILCQLPFKQNIACAPKNKTKKLKTNFKKTSTDKNEKKQELNENFGSDLSPPVKFSFRIRLFGREGGEPFIQ